MQYTVNGETHDTAPLTVAELVASIAPAANGVAVAVNGDVIPRSAWDRTIDAGDAVDVLTAVQGG